MQCIICGEKVDEKKFIHLSERDICLGCARRISHLFMQVPKKNGNRLPIPNEIKKNIIERDKYYCRYCGKGLDDDSTTFDHIIPVSRGGETIKDNVVMACRTCNGTKGTRLLAEIGWKLLPHPKPLMPGQKLQGHLEEMVSKKHGRFFRVVAELPRSPNGKRNRIVKRFYGTRRQAEHFLHELLEKERYRVTNYL